MDRTKITPSLPSILVSFPGGKRVDADLGSRVIRTDQSVAQGGMGSAAGPFELFLASLATCAGYYVLSFCQSRGIPSDGIVLVQRHQLDEVTRRLGRVEIELSLPPTFPEKYRSAVAEAASGCKVKRLLLSPPEVLVTTRVTEPSLESRQG
jgi:ribosomal protein S12 methylthiotransferase accessory factor